MSEHVFKQTKRGLEFVGDFDKLYASEADPWGQSGNDERMRLYYRHSRNALMDVLKAHYPGKARGLEVGCGMGYLTQRLNLQPGWTVTGMDISKTAIEKARSKNPMGSYTIGDITSRSFPTVKRYDFLILAQCWWYIMHAMQQTVMNCLRSVKVGGLIILSQAFLQEQKYGNDIAEGIDGAMQMFARFKRLRLIHLQYDDTRTYLHHDGVLAYRVIGC